MRLLFLSVIFLLGESRVCSQELPTPICKQYDTGKFCQAAGQPEGLVLWQLHSDPKSNQQKSAENMGRSRFWQRVEERRTAIGSEKFGSDHLFPFEKTIAVLIGIEKYSLPAKREYRPPLPGVGASLDILRDYLISDGGVDLLYEIRDDQEFPNPLAVPGSLMNFLSNLTRYSNMLGVRDRLIIYFGGHGYSRGPRDTYLLLRGSPETNFDHNHAVPTNFFVNLTREAKPNQMVILLDACEVGHEFPSNAQGKPTEEGNAGLLLDHLEGNNRFLLTAGTDTQLTYETRSRENPNQKVTVFAEAFVDAIRSSPTFFAPILPLFDRLGTAVKENPYLENNERPIPKMGVWSGKSTFAFLNPKGELPIAVSHPNPTDRNRDLGRAIAIARTARQEGRSLQSALLLARESLQIARNEVADAAARSAMRRAPIVVVREGRVSASRRLAFDKTSTLLWELSTDGALGLSRIEGNKLQPVQTITNVADFALVGTDKRKAVVVRRDGRISSVSESGENLSDKRSSGLMEPTRMYASPDSKLVAIIGGERNQDVQIVDAALNHQLAFSVQGSIVDVAWSFDGSKLATLSTEHSTPILVWELKAGKHPIELRTNGQIYLSKVRFVSDQCLVGLAPSRDARRIGPYEWTLPGGKSESCVPLAQRDILLDVSTHGGLLVEDPVNRSVRVEHSELNGNSFDWNSRIAERPFAASEKFEALAHLEDRRSLYIQKKGSRYGVTLAYDGLFRDSPARKDLVFHAAGFNNDGSRAAISMNGLSDDGSQKFQVLVIDTSLEPHLISKSEATGQLAFSSDSRYVAIAQSRGRIAVHDLASSNGFVLTGGLGPIRFVQWLSATTVLVGNEYGTVFELSAPLFKAVDKPAWHSSIRYVNGIEWAPSKDKIVLFGSTGELAVFNLPEKLAIASVKLKSPIRNVVMSSEDKLYVIADEGFFACDLIASELRCTPVSQEQPHSLTITPDRKHLAIGYRKGDFDRVAVYSTTDGRETDSRRTLSWPNSLAFSKKGKYLVIGEGRFRDRLGYPGDESARVELFELVPGGKLVKRGDKSLANTVWQAEIGELNGLEFVAVHFGDDDIKMFSLPQLDLLSEFPVASAEKRRLRLSPDGRYIGAGGTIAVWSSEDLISELGKRAIRSLSPDERKLVVR